MPYSINSGAVKLEAISGGNKIKVWNNPSKEIPITLPQTWNITSMPGQTGQKFPSKLYIEGLSTSATDRDIQLRLSYTNGSSVNDNIKITSLAISKVPLGSSEILYLNTMGKVYVPSKYGGTSSYFYDSIGRLCQVNDIWGKTVKYRYENPKA